MMLIKSKSKRSEMILVLFPLLALVVCISAQKFGDSQLVHQWIQLDFDWASEEARTESIKNGSFVPERNILAGIKIYKDDIYLTIPRWRWNSGQPATLLKVVQVNGEWKLRPYPDWASQELNNCKVLQHVQSMEIDPNTGLMYVIDTGRTGIMGSVTPSNRCPAKLVIYNLNDDSFVDEYQFPANVVSRSNNFMNDIVLDYVNNSVQFVYITDVSEGKLYVLDLKKRTSYAIEDKSMKPADNSDSVIVINNANYIYNVAIDGIAMSHDFKYLYYCPLGGYNLYQIPTSSLRNLANTPLKSGYDIRRVGRKVSQADGIAHGNQRLYFGALGLNSLYYWDIHKDQQDQNVGIGHVEMRTQTKIVGNDQTMQWIDTLAFDNKGWLWFVSNRLHLFMNNSMSFNGTNGANMRIWKVYVNDTSYLDGVRNEITGNRGTTAVSYNLVFMLVFELTMGFYFSID